MKLLILLLFIPLSLTAEIIRIDDRSIIELAKSEGRQIHDIESAQLTQELSRRQYEDNFNLAFTGTGYYQNSSEKGLASFIPVYGPTKTASLGLTKTTKFGTSVTASGFTENYSTTTGSIDNKSRTGLNLSVTMDLWQDIFGSLSRANLKGLKINDQRAKYEKEIAAKSYINNLRQIYWSLVANNESLKVSRTLFKITKKQLEDIKARRKSNIADLGDVARMEAQLSQRSSAIKRLEYDKELLYQRLREQMPSLNSKEISLAPYDMNKTITDVLSCSEAIKSKDKVPWDYTLFDEVLDLLKKSYAQTQKVTGKYNDPTISLSGEFQTSGVGEGYSNSYDDMRSDKRTGTALTLSVSIPLDGKKTKSQNINEVLDKKRYLAVRQRYLLQMEGNHSQILKTIDLLRAVVADQKRTGTMLETSLKVSQKKYRQARISLNDLIHDQDLLLQSNLSQIQAKLLVIHTILDYFKVFTETPCSLNKVSA